MARHALEARGRTSSVASMARRPLSQTGGAAEGHGAGLGQGALRADATNTPARTASARSSLNGRYDLPMWRLTGSALALWIATVVVVVVLSATGHAAVATISALPAVLLIGYLVYRNRTVLGLPSGGPPDASAGTPTKAAARRRGDP